jgi:hypothetical protein
MDQLTQFRDTVPLAVTPRAEQMFWAALLAEQDPERAVKPRSRRNLSLIRSPWRLGVAASVAAAVAAGIVTTAVHSAPVPPAPVHSALVGLSAKLLADRASAAALAQPAVSPGQWVYRVVEWNRPHAPRGMPNTGTEAGWETADGGETYGNNFSAGVDPGDPIPSYSQLGSLPGDPAALDAYLAHLVYPDSNPAPDIKGMAAFAAIEDMLTNYVLPPELAAEAYQALAVIPGIETDPRATAIDGQAGVAFVLPPTPQSLKLEIILNASSYQFLARASWGSNSSLLTEIAVVRMVLVAAPGSTQQSTTPPSAAEQLAEQAERADSFSRTGPLVVQPSTWVLRELATTSGHRTVWATADDSSQASYSGGTLSVCSRSAACASTTQWLMLAGPRYTLVNPPFPEVGQPPSRHQQPSLPDTLPQLLATLNSYPTGCSDVAGDCNAVNVIVNLIAGYASHPPGDWFLMLADIPGVTVQHVTDVTGQADLAFRYPFTDGITEIIFNASTDQFAGFVRNGVETVITTVEVVSGPGSFTPVVVQPKAGPLPQASR